MRGAIVVVLTATLGGCILLVDPIETKDHCDIQGSGACADCIRRSCESQIDACCASAECTGTAILGDMDTCGRGDANGCSAALATGRLTKPENDLRSCAASNCASCTEGATDSGAGTHPKWTCATSRDAVDDCASCIYDSCGDKLDDCCADSSCKSDETIQKDLGACIANDTHGCSYSQDEARSTIGRAGVVRACILSNCKKCFGDGLTHTTCTIYDGGKYCQCSSSEVAGDQPCSGADVGGVCIEGKKGCSCGAYACGETSTGCSCSFRGGSNDVSLCQAPAGSSSSSGSTTDPVCCLRLGDAEATCKCDQYQTSCDSDLDEYLVASCARVDVVALLGNRVMKACSR